MPEVSYFKNASLAKFEIIFPFPLEKVICACIPAYEALIFDENVISYQDLGYYKSEDLLKKGYKSKNNRCCTVMNFDVKLVFPLSTFRY